MTMYLLIGCLIFGRSPIHGMNINVMRACVREVCFDVRVADNPVTRAKGLMHEDRLPENAGMLFVFPQESTPTFWMKHTQIALDMLFIDDTDTIVYSVKQAQPCVKDPCPLYTPTRPVSKVLEINGGMANRHGIRVGDRVHYFVYDN